MMKTLNNLRKVLMVLPLLLLFLTVSCENDDDALKSFDIAQLESRIAEAENLIATGVEGTNSGDYQPGSKQSLQDVLNWIYKRIESSETQEDITDATVKLNAAIDKFSTSLVSEAFPWVQQGVVGTSISISENIKPILAGTFTLQAKFYIVDLNPNEFSGNLFATLDGAVLGFSVRYFANGSFEIVTGDGVAYGVTASGLGVLTSGEWLDIAFTNSGSEQKVYVNGVEVLSQSKPYVSSSKDLWIGNSPTWQARMGNLLVKEFTAWNTVLDQATIQANSTASFDGTETSLEAYFPFGSDLGSSFVDNTGNYTARLNGNVTWEAEPPVIVIDYTNINAAIQEITAFKATIIEGDMDGDYPSGTIAFIDELIANANDVVANEGRQTALDDAATTLLGQITIINNALVGNAEGVYIDAENPDAIGFRITPVYTPTGDYTYEFDLRLKTLLMTAGFGDIFGNNVLGLRVNGYTELTEENLLNAGGGWNFTFIDGIGYSGPMFPALTLKPGIWQHVAIIHDSTVRTTGIYVNGVLVGEQTDIDSPLVSANPEIWLGSAFGVKMNGSIKDFRIWDAVRSVNDLDTDITGSEADLQMYFPLDRVNGVKFEDATGNYSGELRGIEWNK